MQFNHNFPIVLFSLIASFVTSISLSIAFSEHRLAIEITWIGVTICIIFYILIYRQIKKERDLDRQT